MAKMHPAVFPKTAAQDDAGERAAFEALERLSDEVTVFYEPELRRPNGARHTPDFVLVVPDLGLFILEAKRWPRIVTSQQESVVLEREGGERFTATHPMKQAKGAMYALKEMLETQSVFGHRDGPHRGKLALPLIPGVLWLGPGTPHVIADQLGGLVPAEVVSLPGCPTPDALESALRSMPRPFRGVVTSEQTERLSELVAKREGPLQAFDVSAQRLISLHRAVREECRLLSQTFAATSHQDQAQTFEELVTRLGASISELRDARFTVGFFGCFSAGKSTLVNALVPEIELPTSDLPTTAVQTSVEHASKEYFEIHPRSRDDLERLNRALPEAEQLDLDRELGAAPDDHDQFRERLQVGGHAAYIRRAVWRLPAPSLARGLRLVDLPGTDSMTVLHRMEAELFIPYADAIVFVVNGTQALSDADADILEAMRRSGGFGGEGRYLFFVNKLDEVRDRAEVIDHVVETLKQRYGFAQPRVVGGSARVAFLIPRRATLSDEEQRFLRSKGRKLCNGAREFSDRDLWRASGLAELTRTLDDILAHRRGPLRLQAAVSKRLGPAMHQLTSWLEYLVSDDDDTERRLREELDTLDERLTRGSRADAERRMADARRNAEAETLRSLGTSEAVERQLRQEIDDTAPGTEAARSLLEALDHREREWTNGFAERFGQVHDSLSREQSNAAAEFLSNLSGTPSDANPDGHGAHAFAITSQEAFWAFKPDNWDSTDKSLLAALAAGAGMGMVKGSIFPGAGNAAGALIGATIAGIAFWGGSRVLDRRKLNLQLAQRWSQLRAHLESATSEILDLSHAAAVASLDRAATDLRNDLVGKQRVRRDELARTRAQREALEASRERTTATARELNTFCADHGLELPISEEGTALVPARRT